jgi:peptidoglycan-associated lipoprotein
LTEGMRNTLNAHADQMMLGQRLLMQIEGHCDRLGSTEYNLALGDLRARTVKEYLVRRGVPAGRVSTVSYGAEMPISARDRENRRAEFRVRR